MEPLFTSIQHPIRLSFYALYPQSTKIEKQFLLGWYESNDFENENISLIDFEITTLALSYTHPYSDTSSFRIIVPIHYVWGGFMDKPLDWFHDATGLLNGSEHNIYGDNKTYYKIGSYLDSKGPFGMLGNIQIENTTLLPLAWYGAKYALSAGIKFPTNTKKGFSSKRADFALTFIAQKDPFLLNLSLLYLGSFHLGSYASSRNFAYSAYLGYQYKKWVIEFRYLSSFFKAKYSTLDSDSNVLNIAYNINKKVRFFVSENLQPFYGSPDFTIGVTYNF